MIAQLLHAGTQQMALVKMVKNLGQKDQSEQISRMQIKIMKIPYAIELATIEEQ